ncbi:hypothetical protein [Streptomyces sp. SID161]|uniref:hypothetical protein n=1 Tax=Streptomyces sp. SID161 TaxID=2690251 RepID=UPI001367EA13|nr:hypothetical protein [Streptomyces sp. SID161]MYW43055.1 hypothetical protein [Streptomyces sp. SID161]
MTLPQPKRNLVPHPVERRIVEVMQEGQELSEEQRMRIAAWLEANGVEPRRVAQKTITVECKVSGNRESRHVIGFHEYYETPDGHRTINERTLEGALTFQRWVAQTVPLEPDPEWEGWDERQARLDKMKMEGSSE